MTLSISTSVHAADLDQPGFDWTGFYAGVHLGYGWGNAKFTTRTGVPRYPYNIDGILGGIQAGYNFQMDSFVFGLEGDFSGTSIDGSTSWAAGTRNASLDINWLATIAARAGVAMDRSLFYAKGGLALADTDYRHLGGPGLLRGNATRTGWLIGAGVEHAFDNAWSAKIEYNFMDFGTKNVALPRAPGGTRAMKQNVNVIKVGLNYRF